MQIKMEAALPVALVITLAATLADGTRVAHRFPPDPTAPARLLEHLDKQPGLWAGFIDPTQPPYSAKGDGVSDDGPSLQSAVDDAYTARMSVVLPAGKTFLMAQQLGFLQRNRSRAFGFQIFGGDGPQRPVLKLKVRRRLVLSLSLSLSLQSSSRTVARSNTMVRTYWQKSCVFLSRVLAVYLFHCFESVGLRHDIFLLRPQGRHTVSRHVRLSSGGIVALMRHSSAWPTQSSRLAGWKHRGQRYFLVVPTRARWSRAWP